MNQVFGGDQSIPEVGLGSAVGGLRPRAEEHGKRDPHEDADDEDDHHQLDEGEPVLGSFLPHG